MGVGSWWPQRADEGALPPHSLGPVQLSSSLTFLLALLPFVYPGLPGSIFSGFVFTSVLAPRLIYSCWHILLYSPWPAL